MARSQFVRLRFIEDFLEMILGHPENSKIGKYNSTDWRFSKRAIFITQARKHPARNFRDPAGLGDMSSCAALPLTAGDCAASSDPDLNFRLGNILCEDAQGVLIALSASGVSPTSVPIEAVQVTWNACLMCAGEEGRAARVVAANFTAGGSKFCCNTVDANGSVHCGPTSSFLLVLGPLAVFSIALLIALLRASRRSQKVRCSPMQALMLTAESVATSRPRDSLLYCAGAAQALYRNRWWSPWREDMGVAIKPCEEGVAVVRAHAPTSHPNVAGTASCRT